MILCFAVASFLFNFLSEVSGSNCDDISGRWYNQLGSEVEIDHLNNGQLFGKYYTAVSQKGGGLIGHDLVGALPYNKSGSSFSFTVNWQNGSSTTVWTGQCQVCDGKETLETSWLLRSFVESCIDKWKSTLIGKDIFFRKTNKTASPEGPKRFEAIQEPSPESKCNLQGIWYNDVGSEVILNQTKDGLITGEYRTAVERETGSAGSTHSLVYGSGFYGNPNSTFSLIVVWREGQSVTGWVGQCHICGENKTAVLEMSWLLRTKVEKCSDVWKSTMYGTNSFTRHEQRPGPRKSLGTHTPNREGEDDGTGNSPKSVAPCFWLIFVLISSYLKLM